MRMIALFIGLALLACATLASHQHKPFALLIDAAAPTDARPPAMLVAPCPIGPRNLPIRNPERDA